METKKKFDINRKSNILWTVSENYSLVFDSGLRNEYWQRNINNEEWIIFYQSIVLGGVHKFLDYELLYSWIDRSYTQFSDPELFKEILWLAVEEYCMHRLLQERPGIEYIRKKSIQSITDNFFFQNSKRPEDDIRKAYYFRKIKKIFPSNHRVQRLVSELEKAAMLSDSKEFFSFLENLFYDFFHFEFSFSESETEDENEFKKRNYQVNTYKALDQSLSYDKEMNKISDEYTSAEFSSNVTGMEMNFDSDEKENNGALKFIQESDERVRRKVESLFGKQILSFDEKMRLEKTFSINIHEGQKIHITKGFFSDYNKDEYRILRVNQQKEENLQAFKENAIVHNRNITRLKDTFLRTMSQNREISYHRAESGRINLSSVWRFPVIRDEKIFFKGTRDSGSSFVVDILLDASGSQQERQSVVATQGYILSKALSLCGIPNRVSGFNNFMNYTVIKIFRDYQDEEAKNKEIFNYYASGSNRDGLAIALIVDSLLKQPEEYKILIVLSDGKPNDTSVIRRNAAFGNAKDYVGKKAIDDTAFAVRKARMSGISVLGVFTGELEDLETEKLIYGKDFAYINNIERFSDIVGLYLKRHINNLSDHY